MHIILITPVISGQLFYMTLKQCSLARSHKTGLNNISNINEKTKRKRFEKYRTLAVIHCINKSGFPLILIYILQHYVIKLVSDLRQVGDFLLGPPISSTNKADRHDIAEILLKVASNIIKQTNKHITC